MDVSTRREHPANLCHDEFGIANMFQDGVALHAGEDRGGKRELLGISRDVDPVNCEEVQIHVAWDLPAGTQVKVPAAERKIEGLGRIRHERCRRFQEAKETVAPSAGISLAIKSFQIQQSYLRMT